MEKLLSPKEYRLSNKSVSLEDYINYLLDEQIEIELLLMNDHEIPLNGELITEIEIKLNDIMRMKEIIKLRNEKQKLKELNEKLKRIEEEIEKSKTEILKISKTLSRKIDILKAAKSIIKDPSYHTFFKKVEKQNLKLLYQVMGLNETGISVEPILKQERIRLKEIKNMIDIITEAEKLSEEYYKKTRNSGFFTRVRSSFNEELKILKTKYNIFINSFKTQKTKLNQTFWNKGVGIGRKTKNLFLAREKNFDKWNEFANYLADKQESLIRKLLTFSIDENGFYKFNTNELERKELLEVQNKIVSICTLAYNERKSFKEELENEEISLEPEKVKTLEKILGEKSNLSRENLASFIKKTENEIEESLKYLYNHKELCRELKIDLPQRSINTLEQTPYDTDIRNLNIDGITSLEEALIFKELLLELEEYKHLHLKS